MKRILSSARIKGPKPFYRFWNNLFQYYSNPSITVPNTNTSVADDTLMLTSIIKRKIITKKEKIFDPQKVKLTPPPSYFFRHNSKPINPKLFTFCDFPTFYCCHFRHTTGVKDQLPESLGHCLNYAFFACNNISSFWEIYNCCINTYNSFLESL